MKNLKIFLLFALVGLTSIRLSAHEGMWIPSTLAKLVVGDMQAMGLQLEAEDIYSINNSSIKDAIVHFGGGCTAEVISDNGLILTNHHCGYSQIQFHSSLENDYLTDGFWAMNHSEELQNPNLTATFVVRIEDVSDQMKKAAKDLRGEAREAALATMARNLERNAVEGTHYKAEVKPFFYGNAHYMIVTETFLDVRMVGAPPSSIGKFGGDTDNWMWPRHTGDFALFRIYAGPDNKPAPYSEDNVPYRPKYSLPISMDGLKDGDFTMVFGFPGFTEQYLTSHAVEYVVEVQNPARIAMREAALGVIDAAMAANDKTRIQYASKQSRISNAYKKWIGQSMGLERFDAIDKKLAQEARFIEKARTTKGYEGLSQLPTEFADLYERMLPYRLSRDYLIEFYYYGPEVLRYAANYRKLVELRDSLEKAGTWEDEVAKLEKSLDGFFKNFNAEVDRGVMAAQMDLFLNGAPEMLHSATLKNLAAKHRGKETSPADELASKSVFYEESKLRGLLQKSPKKVAKTISSDPIFKISTELLNAYGSVVQPKYAELNDELDAMMQRYVQATMDLFPDKTYWPDANSTIRLTFGKMEGTEPQDGLIYKPYTTLDGVVQKYIPGDRDFDVPERLLELHANRDYGPYATDGEMRVCFIGSNHTTGGNSGSPALNARGELVGLNFDRTWESTMSDIMFNGEICRNIMVDAKYILFIIDKFAGAGHLIDEMNLVYSEDAKPNPVHEAEDAPAEKEMGGL